MAFYSRNNDFPLKCSLFSEHFMARLKTELPLVVSQQNL